MSMCVRVYVNVCVRVFLCLSALVVVFLPFSPPSPPLPPFFVSLKHAPARAGWIRTAGRRTARPMGTGTLSTKGRGESRACESASRGRRAPPPRCGRAAERTQARRRRCFQALPSGRPAHRRRWCARTCFAAPCIGSRQTASARQQNKERCAKG